MRAILLVLAACGALPILGAAVENAAAVARKTVPGSAVHTPRPWIIVRGKVTVKDGHTLVFADGLEVQLEDGPDLDQLGKIGDWFYPAGREARAFLQKLIGEHDVKMFVNAGSEEYRRGERVIGDCYVDNVNLGHELIKNGWALADHSITSPMEIMAREDQRGLWRGQFVLPAKWRKGERLPGEYAPMSAGEKAALWELGGRFQIEDGHVVALSLGENEVNEPALGNLKHLSHLRSLEISGPKDGIAITDVLLSPLAGLAQLKSLHLSHLHGVSDAGLVHLQALSQLERLEITHTRTIGGSGLQHVRGLGQLQLLDFNHTPITDEGLEYLSGLSNLKSLGLRATQVTDRGMEHLKGLVQLESLNLWETQVTDDGLAIVARLPGIKRLGLVNAAITATGLAHLKKLPALEDLEIRNIQGGDEAALAQVGKLIHVKRLEFGGMRATAAGMEHLKNLSNLQELEIGGSQFSDAGLAHLKGLSSLRTLNLLKVPITDEGVAHLATLTALEELHLTDTKITDAGLVHLGGLTRLNMLGLSGTSVTDEGLKRLAVLKKLRRVDLLHCPVTDDGVKRLKAALPELFVYYQ